MWLNLKFFCSDVQNNFKFSSGKFGGKHRNQQKITCQVLAELNKIWSCQIFIKLSGATGAARAPKPDKTPIMAARHCCCRRLLFFNIKVRPRSCRSYHIWHPWVRQILSFFVKFWLWLQLSHSLLSSIRSLLKSLMWADSQVFKSHPLVYIRHFSLAVLFCR